jgi:hypothetical protein
MKIKNTESTKWELWAYDVWGNRNDGYEVNDRSCFNRSYEINLKIEVNNPHTNNRFLSAFPSDYQIQKAFNTRSKLDIYGDDTTIYVNRESDSYPIGEMVCISHESLSPIRLVKEA